MMIRRDVLVVGAGPAGSTAAEMAAAAGCDVLIVDRKAEIGSPVQCGGFVPEAFELGQLLPNAHLPQSLVEIPSRCLLHRTSLQRLYSPYGRTAQFSVAGRCLDRRAFDRYLAGRAARAGAEIAPGTRFVPGRENRLCGRASGKVQAEVIIGADGPSSATARLLGVSPRAGAEVGVCIEYEMVGVDIDAQAAEMYFGTAWAPGGYAWIIPLGQDSANVGIGIRPSYLSPGQSLTYILDRFIARHPQASQRLGGGKVVAVMKGLVPSGGMPSAIAGPGILLAGDAAGQVMATSGGGIPLAMVGGRLAGETAEAYVRGEGQLSDYPSRIDEEMGRELGSSVKIRSLVDLVMRSDRSMDLLFSRLEPEMMKDIMRGKMPGRLGSICSKIGL